MDIACTCGRSIRVKEEHIGKRIQCRACGQVLLLEDRPAPRPAQAHPEDTRRDWWTGILDIFRPKWKHSDWHVRLRAVDALQKESVASHLATGDPHGDVRDAAHARLQQLLAARAKGPEYDDCGVGALRKGIQYYYKCGQDAVSKLEDIGLLADVALVEGTLDFAKTVVNPFKT